MIKTDWKAVGGKKRGGLATSAKMNQWKGDGDCRFCSSLTLLRDAPRREPAQERERERGEAKCSFSKKLQRPDVKRGQMKKKDQAN